MKYVIIIVDEIDNTQRILIHELVKNRSDAWWHELPNIWVAKSEARVGEWRDWLKPMVPIKPSSVLILAMKETLGYRWAFTGDSFTTFGKWFESTAEPEVNPDTQPDEPF